MGIATQMKCDECGLVKILKTTETEAGWLSYRPLIISHCHHGLTELVTEVSINPDDEKFICSVGCFQRVATRTVSELVEEMKNGQGQSSA